MANIAIKRKNGDYVAYNRTTGRIFNAKKVVINSDKISKFFFLIPTASNMLAEGDIINNNGCYYYVKKCNGCIKAVNLSNGTNSTIAEEDNIFGMPTHMKLVSMLGGMQCIGSGGINPMMLMMMCGNKDDFDPMMIAMMGGMFNGSGGMFGTGMQQQNPMFGMGMQQFQQMQCQPQQNCTNADETVEE